MQIPELTREQAQLLSVIAMLFGVFLITTTQHIMSGVSCVGFACWIMVINESILLTRVQIEMHRSLDHLANKRESEVKDLLYFLRESEIASSPFTSIQGAKRLCNNIHYPAMVLTSTHQIIVANSHMHRLLGYKHNELSDVPVYKINDPFVMSAIGEIASIEKYENKLSMISQYMHIHKDGSSVFGQMDAHKINNEGFMVVFHPTDDCAISYEEIRMLAKHRK